MVALLDSAPASTAIPARFRETARELLSETWSAARAIENAWHTTFVEFESCRAELLSQQLRSQEEQLRLDQLRAQLTAEHLQAIQEREHEIVELQEQRTILEMELELARQQTEQLTAQLSELRQQQALDREGMQAELRELRLAVERPWSDGPMAHEHSPKVTAPVIEAAAKATPRTSAAEPGLDSVLNHFQALQKDLARRRVQPKTPKPSS